ncbi:MAG: LytTR family transcriptional regulator [Alphaproteobacteria bacterium]|nr:LytTR family transcriptional regulator [Alphaproteobacteria bacterium]
MVTGWILMVNVAAAIDRIEPLQAWPVAGRMALAGFIGAAPMAGIVWLLEALFRRPLPLEAVPELFMNTTVLAIVVAVAIGQVVEMRLRARAGAAELMAERAQPDAPATVSDQASSAAVPAAVTSDPAAVPSAAAIPAAAPTPASTQSDAFLRRLPAPLGRDLLALEMEDHYARVHTALGSTLILLRLRDAVAELGDDSGLQVHRSWWVAHNAVAHTERDGGKLVLVLRNGLRVPVSKTYRDAVKAARWGET